MACYISSQQHRVYVAEEEQLGEAAALNGSNRIPVVRLAIRQRLEETERRDKTGSRTFPGLPVDMRRRTRFELTTPMTSWSDTAQQPAQGALFRAAMGGEVSTFAGGVVANAAGPRVTFAGAHGLQAGQGVSFGGELRFVASVADETSVDLNAPFTLQPSAGTSLGPCVTYRLGTELGSVTMRDAWDPATAVQRMLAGAVVDELTLQVNGDFHEFVAAGPAAELVDSETFESGQAGLTEFPEEPAVTSLDPTVVPGHLGQAWLGNGATQFLTLTDGEVKLRNGAELSDREFGARVARCASAGTRQVDVTLGLYAKDDAESLALYQAARLQTPQPVMLQLGQRPGQLVGVYLPSVRLETPEFDDREPRLEWTFRNCRAQGTQDDELFIAFA